MSPSDRYRRPRICPDCFAPFKPDLNRCWLCGWKIGDPIRQSRLESRSFDKQNDEPVRPTYENLKWTFSLSTMFLWTTLAASLAALTRMAPGFGIAVIVLSFPAALRTIVAVGHRGERTGKPLTASEKVFIFANSMLLAMLAGVAAVAAFMAVCTVTMPLSLISGRFAGILVGVISLAGAGYAAYAVMRARWNEED